MSTSPLPNSRVGHGGSPHEKHAFLAQPTPSAKKVSVDFRPTKIRFSSTPKSIENRSVGLLIDRSVDFPLISGNFWATVDFVPKIFDFPGGGPVLVSSRGQMNRPPGWGTTQDALGATSDGVTPAFLAWGNPIQKSMPILLFQQHGTPCMSGEGWSLGCTKKYDFCFFFGNAKLWE